MQFLLHHNPIHDQLYDTEVSIGGKFDFFVCLFDVVTASEERIWEHNIHFILTHKLTTFTIRSEGAEAEEPEISPSVACLY